MLNLLSNLLILSAGPVTLGPPSLLFCKLMPENGCIIRSAPTCRGAMLPTGTVPHIDILYGELTVEFAQFRMVALILAWRCWVNNFFFGHF